MEVNACSFIQRQVIKKQILLMLKTILLIFRYQATMYVRNIKVA